MLVPIKKTKHNLRVCDLWNRADDCYTIFDFYKRPSQTKISIYATLDKTRRDTYKHSPARVCGNSDLFTYMYTFESGDKLYLRRISKGSEEDIEVTYE